MKWSDKPENEEAGVKSSAPDEVNGVHLNEGGESERGGREGPGGLGDEIRTSLVARPNVENEHANGGGGTF